ncbi:hypothetical protein EVAR_1025_1 [Eumeta japonica]|uniref:Uncharacterized protein n=1 Tax=Eumeta variegata TaxID=151549 RepID=A0A4C1SHB5_EUMVA|nr:hypothetical protein EVAR_1025_1 [Eumeta japonica]
MFDDPDLTGLVAYNQRPPCRTNPPRPKASYINSRVQHVVMNVNNNSHRARLSKMNRAYVAGESDGAE